MQDQASHPEQFAFRGNRIRFKGTPLLMGIVNLTPDSFSDGGMYNDVDAAAAQAVRLAGEGAEIIDVGGESTRPGHVPVSVDEELSRVIPAIHAIRKLLDVPVSVDTSKPEVARAAIEAGAEIVNDVTACRDPRMYDVLREFRPGCVLMDDRILPGDASARLVVREYLVARRDEIAAATGLAHDSFLLDPGVGFGKTLEQNLDCIRYAGEFADGESGVLLGVSRKSFIGRICGEADPMKRLPGTLAAALLAPGVHFLRVHDVGAHRQALMVAEEILRR